MASTAGILRQIQGGFAITPAAAPLARPVRWLYCGGSGDLTVQFISGETVTFFGLAAGVVHPIAATHVTAFTGTNLIGGD